MSRARLEIALLAVALLALTPLVAGDGEDASGAVRKPNIVLITTDDQTLASLRVMDRVQRELVDRGVTFENALATFPLCCPSRASWITGQYAHNHGVIDNQERNGGGYQALREPDKVLPAWLDAGGYDTALVGKWLHDYRTLDPAPGWDRFWALTAPTMVNYYGYEVTDSRGGRVRYGKDADDYVTDALTRDYALPYIRQHERDPDPFFLHVSYIAPHWGRGRNDAAGRRCANGKPFAFETAKAKPAPRDAGAFGEAKLPTPPSFNEADMSDKPGAVRGRERLSRREIRVVTERYRCELASLLAVDRAVGEITAAIDEAHLSRRTYVIFTSDNGYMHGEHRIRAEKVQPYEEALRVPLVIAGPAIPPGVTVNDPVANVDLAPTILELAEVQVPDALQRPVDGRSLAPYTYGRGDPDRAVPIEAKRPPRRSATGTFVAPSWIGVRTARYLYVEHYRAEVPTLAEGFGLEIGAGSVTDVELYDLAADPHELISRHADSAYVVTRAALAGAVGELRRCAGEACRFDLSVPPPR
ncbi:MAG: sulfatase [Solirubrobacterales bacterium]